MHIFFAAVFLLLGTSIDMAGPLPQPEGKAVLTVSGNVAETNRQGLAVLDQGLLESLEFVTIETETPWTDGVSRFKGPRLRDVLARVGASGETVFASAVNDYTVSLPASDAEQYNVIVALEVNGKPLSRRTKGPAWIIYPLSDHPELNNSDTLSKMIWQLVELRIQD